jgi:hypothetical protein
MPVANATQCKRILERKEETPVVKLPNVTVTVVVDTPFTALEQEFVKDAYCIAVSLVTQIDQASLRCQVYQKTQARRRLLQEERISYIFSAAATDGAKSANVDPAEFVETIIESVTELLPDGSVEMDQNNLLVSPEEKITGFDVEGGEDASSAPRSASIMAAVFVAFCAAMLV